MVPTTRRCQQESNPTLMESRTGLPGAPPPLVVVEGLGRWPAWHSADLMTRYSQFCPLSQPVNKGLRAMTVHWRGGSTSWFTRWLAAMCGVLDTSLEGHKSNAIYNDSPCIESMKHVLHHARHVAAQARAPAQLPRRAPGAACRPLGSGGMITLFCRLKGTSCSSVSHCIIAPARGAEGSTPSLSAGGRPASAAGRCPGADVW